MCVTVFSQISTTWNATRSRIAMETFNIICEVCSQAFKRKDLLSRHMLMHSSDPNFKCKTFGKQFNRESSLTRHKGVHEPHTREVLFL
jgi:uncharacterized Zn-finger protein